MNLSVIIVNYNVKFFLEQCLQSVEKASVSFIQKYGQNSLETFVVDNNSVDGSVEMVKENFKNVILIENNTNTGFAKANNQAISISKGEFVLLLNPDTLIQEDTFIKIIDFIDKNPQAGALGVKMIDGSGKFLPESKRGLPTPSVAFYKIFGISKIFPKSKKFGKYHLSYLDKDKTHEVDVLSGAFMLLRKEALDKTGFLDEDFFMYGEDIDLSYRITKAGYKNYYFPETVIIHYKGESTKKGSLNYVFIFYNAMIIFAKKHFSSKNAGIFSFFIKTAIWLRAFISILNRAFKNSFLPVLDSILIFFGFYFIKPLWESYKFPSGGTYPKEYLMFAVPFYIFVLIFSVFISGGYERPAKNKNLSKGILYGTFVLLMIYSLLDESYRYSRLLLLAGSGWALISTYSIRKFFSILKIHEFGFKTEKQKNLIIIASKNETSSIEELIKISKIPYKISSVINPDNNLTDKLISETIKISKANEIIFNLKETDSKRIIEIMLLLSDYDIDFKIAGEKSLSIIGSSSVNSSGELYSVDLNSINKKINARKKRIFDIVISLLLLVFSPVFLFYVDLKINFIKNIFKVFAGKLSLVGYKFEKEEEIIKLPKLKKGILNPSDIQPELFFDSADYYGININYAKNYKIYNDLLIIFSGFKELGRLIN